VEFQPSSENPTTAALAGSLLSPIHQAAVVVDGNADTPQYNLIKQGHPGLHASLNKAYMITAVVVAAVHAHALAIAEI
jgi:hypothetical protein